MENKKLCVLVAAAACFFSHNAIAALVAGPDAYGYIAESTGFNLRDIQSTGTKLPGGDDELFQVPIGFDFAFKNSTMNSILAGINGYLANDSSAQDFEIRGYSDDLTNLEGLGDIYYQTIGDAGSREFIVGYYGVTHFPPVPPDNLLQMTFEIILHEGTNHVELQYAELFDQIDQRHGSIGLRHYPVNPGNDLRIHDAIGYHEYTGFVISQVPVPAAVWLFGSGLIGLIGMARRKA